LAHFLITGGAGFIGSHLVHALLERGDQVRVLDNFETGLRKNLEPVRDRIELHESDLADADAVRKACEGVDYIFHEGALPSVPRRSIEMLGSSRFVDALGRAAGRMVRPGP